MIDACSAPALAHLSDIQLRRLQALVFMDRFADAGEVAGPLYDMSWRGDRAALVEVSRVAHVMDPDVAAHEAAWRDARPKVYGALRASLLVDALRAAEDYLKHTRLSWDDQAYGMALLASAVVRDMIGFEEPARTAFHAAKEWLAPWPERVIWVRLKLGLFMLDLAHDDPAQVADAVGVLEPTLDDARALVAAGIEVASLLETIDAALINLAYAYRQTDQLDLATAALEQVTPDARTMVNTRLVEALLLSARRDEGAAAAMLAAIVDTELEDDYRWERLLEQGHLAQRAGRIEDADDFYRKAIEVVEATREKTDLDLRPWFLARRTAPHAARLTLLDAADRPDEALAVADALHARSVLDAIVIAEQAGDASIGRAVVMQDVARSLRAAAIHRPLTADEARSLVADRELLAFTEVHGRIWRFHLKDGAADIEELERAVAAEVLTLVEQWRAQPNDLALAAALGKLLLPAALGPATQPLYLVASGRLALVAFPALRHGDRFLIEARPLIRLPALTALRCRTAPPATDPPLFLGDAAGDLPAARIEVLALDPDARVGSRATLASLDAARRASLLHIAVHGSPDDRGGALALADGRLGAAAVLQRDLAPDVVVLAGCATAHSPDPEGSRALPAAFLAAGSRAVVATVRDVEDRDAAVMMHAFYANGGARQPVAALTATQRAQAQARPDQPSAWGSYAVWEAGCTAPAAPP